MAEETSLSQALRAGYGTLGQGFLSTHYKKPISTCWLIVLAKARVGTNLGLSNGKPDSTSCIEGLSIRLRIQMGLGQGEAVCYHTDQVHQDA